tara:strand:- start:567 stop:1076 length:510 start_codon:yes stop_codon:yes gene_type:complete
MAEIKIKCPNCFSEEKCFEETVVRENEDDFKSYLCFHCGFTSNSFYTKDNKARAQHLETTAELIKELEFFDEERQIYWYPSVINMGPKGIIFPEGNLETWYWRYAEVIFIPEGERENYPVPGKDGEFYESRLDVEGAKRFGQFEFLDACTDMGLVKDNLESNIGSSGVI